MTDEPLAVCPACGQPIERVISLCSVSAAQSTKSKLSDKNLKEKGFTKLVNEGGGKFRNVTPDSRQIARPAGKRRAWGSDVRALLA